MDEQERLLEADDDEEYQEADLLGEEYIKDIELTRSHRRRRPLRRFKEFYLYDYVTVVYSNTCLDDS